MSRYPKKKSKLNNAAQVLQGLFQNGKSPLASSFKRWRLEQEWAAVIGESLASCSRPVDFHQGLLTVAVTNPTLLTELQYFRPILCKKVNKHLGDHWVRRVRFVCE